jgi:hypothetical protein
MHLFAPPGVVVGPLALGGFSYSNAKMLGEIPTPTFIYKTFIIQPNFYKKPLDISGLQL